MPILWDPISVLNLPAHHTCVGKASHHSHCGARVNKENAAKIGIIVRDMAHLPADPDKVYELLVSLALCGLCKKYHGRQLPVMIEEWVGKIEDHMYMASKNFGQGSASEAENNQPHSSSSMNEHLALREALVAGPMDPETVTAHTPDGNLTAYHSQLESAATIKYLLVLPVMLMVILIGIAIAMCFNSSATFPLALSQFFGRFGMAQKLWTKSSTPAQG